MAWLLDTNVVSEFRKGARANPRVIAWAAQTPPEEMFISVVATGELWRRVEQVRRRDAMAAEFLEAWVRKVEHAYRNQILVLDRDIARPWGGLSVAQPLPPEDALIAATALHHDLTVATRNIPDFERSGAKLFDPWTFGA